MASSPNFIGDIKYSLIEPGVFLKENPEWALLQGQTLDAASPLYQLGIQNLPDARGVFLRGMNLGREKEKGDTDGDRVVGVAQDDMVGPHNHQLPKDLLWKGGVLKGGVSAAFIDVIQNGSTEANNGAETRPRNICLYIYVKIK